MQNNSLNKTKKVWELVRSMSKRGRDIVTAQRPVLSAHKVGKLIFLTKSMQVEWKREVKVSKLELLIRDVPIRFTRIPIRVLYIK